MPIDNHLMADLHRIHGRTSVALLARSIIVDRPFRAIATLRLCQAVDRRRFGRFVRIPAQVLHRITCQLAGMDLPWRVEVGPGLAINHGWGLVVSPGARIGANVTLFHGVTLGQRDRIDAVGERETSYPALADDVWVGPNALVVGGVTVGRGARIAGASFVVKDVEPGAMVAGGIATTVRSDVPADVHNPAPVAAPHR